MVEENKWKRFFVPCIPSVQGRPRPSFFWSVLGTDPSPHLPFFSPYFQILSHRKPSLCHGPLPPAAEGAGTRHPAAPHADTDSESETKKKNPRGLRFALSGELQTSYAHGYRWSSGAQASPVRAHESSAMVAAAGDAVAAWPRTRHRGRL